MTKPHEYHQGNPTAVRRSNGVMCMNPSCTSSEGGCERCGWNQEEAELRRRIPLEEYKFEVKDKDGNVIGTEIRRRKNLGRLRRIEAMVDGHG